MEKLAGFLQAIGYHAVLIQPLLPMNLHLILSALFPIYAGAHASLSRPSSAAKPSKRKKRDNEDENEPDEHEQKMEGMSPSDAIVLPLFAGATLAGLYFLIKWLEDPAILNKILNWYFSIFGVLALARLGTDMMGTVTSFIFPSMYTSANQVWTIDVKQRKAVSGSSEPETRDSPLPGRLALLPLPEAIKGLLWKLRELPSQKLHIRIFIRHLLRANVKIGPQGFISFLLALTAQVYFNLIAKPWWLTNLLGFSLAYNALQLISPTTSATGTLILCALFIYDIYFVFFTPLMVTVATKLDIPAKLLFPRPSAPGDDPAKQALSMLGLGDIVLPGMMIGFALRFDLYLYYLHKQMHTETEQPLKSNESNEKDEGHSMEKDTYYPATSGWGERFWTSRRAIVTSSQYHGILFPKTYFHATLVGYIAGLVCTLGIMQIFGHAQPALLYLVPGVLAALWGTALINGDVKALWEYSEEVEDEEKDAEGKGKKDKTEETNKHSAAGWWKDWKSILFSSSSSSKPAKTPKPPSKANLNDQAQSKAQQTSLNIQDPSDSKPYSPTKFHRDRQTELVFFSVNLPSGGPSDGSSNSTTSKEKI